jgi:hypothetical protein
MSYLGSSVLHSRFFDGGFLGSTFLDSTFLGSTILGLFFRKTFPLTLNFLRCPSADGRMFLDISCCFDADNGFFDQGLFCDRILRVAILSSLLVWESSNS